MPATPERAAFVSEAYRSSTWESQAVRDAYGKVARDTKDVPFESFFDNQNDAQIMLNERGLLLGSHARRFRVVVDELLLEPDIDLSETVPTAQVIDSELNADIACGIVALESVDFDQERTSLNLWGLFGNAPVANAKAVGVASASGSAGAFPAGTQMSKGTASGFGTAMGVGQAIQPGQAVGAASASSAAAAGSSTTKTAAGASSAAGSASATGQDGALPTSVDLSTPGASSWTVPAGWNTVQVELVGAGGKGGNSASGFTAGGGGGGGQYQRVASIAVTPGASINYQVGTGSGTRGTSGSPGTGDSWFSSGTTAYAQAGTSAATGLSGPNAGGNHAAVNGATKFDGGSGGQSGPSNTILGAGGGGAAGPTGAGGNGASINGGAVNQAGASGGTGDGGSVAAVSGVASNNGAAGNSGTYGGGGGSGASNGFRSGGAGGSHGGGGGGAGGATGGFAGGGAGGNGFIRITKLS